RAAAEHIQMPSMDLHAGVGSRRRDRRAGATRRQPRIGRERIGASTIDLDESTVNRCAAAAADEVDAPDRRLRTKQRAGGVDLVNDVNAMVPTKSDEFPRFAAVAQRPDEVGIGIESDERAVEMEEANGAEPVPCR